MSCLLDLVNLFSAVIHGLGKDLFAEEDSLHLDNSAASMESCITSFFPPLLNDKVDSSHFPSPTISDLIVAQHRWTNILEGEEIGPSLCVAGGQGLKMTFPALLLEDAGMQSLQRKGAVWHRCPAAEALP